MPELSSERRKLTAEKSHNVNTEYNISRIGICRDIDYRGLEYHNGR